MFELKDTLIVPGPQTRCVKHHPTVIEVAIVEDRREIRDSLALLIGGTPGLPVHW